MQEISATQFVPRRFPITVKMFNVMANEGAFEPGERIELIGGEIFDMSPIGNLHARCVKFLANYLIQSLNGIYIVGVQDPVVLDDLSEPQPDLSVLRYRPDFYKEETPSAKDIILIVEVADTTAIFDRGIKLRRYASAGVSEYWLIDLVADHVEVHTNPDEDSYGSLKIFRRGENVSSEAIPAIELSVDEILG